MPFAHKYQKEGGGKKDKKIEGGKNVLEHGGGTSNDSTTQKRGCTYETRAVGAHTQWGGGIGDEANNNNNTRSSPCNDGL